MPLSLLFSLILLFAALSFLLTRARAAAGRPPSSPVYYGSLAALAAALPPILLIAFWLGFESFLLQTEAERALKTIMSERPASELQMIADSLLSGQKGGFFAKPELIGLSETMAERRGASRFLLSLFALLFAAAGGALAWRSLRVSFPARFYAEKALRLLMFAAAAIGLFITAGIFLSLIFETLRFFQLVSLDEFFFGTKWSPQTALREGQVGASGAFGALPLFGGTFLITAIAIAIAGPIGLFSAIHTAEYASPSLRSVAKPLLEILAGIPTVVYGFFAALTVAPFIRDAASFFGLQASSESALAAGLVMGIMIIPFISSLSDDVIASVPDDLRAASYALGATKSETIKRVLLPAALPGILGAFLLAISRAIGETMIVVMAAGLAAKLTANPLDAVTTVTAQIVALLVGDQSFDSAKTLAAFALGFTLFLMTLSLNAIALAQARRYRRRAP